MLLECKNVCTSVKGFSLKNIDFSLPEGYLMGITGKNGSGKTTLLHTLLSCGKGYEGEILLAGKDLRIQKERGLNSIGYISDEQKFFEGLSAGKNGELLGVFYENWDKELFEEMLKKMNLPVSKKVGNMSRGEKVKFQMAFAMAHHSKLYLIDEATAGMDPIFRKEFYRILKNALDGEAAAILVTHIQSELDRNMDYIAVMENGKMISFYENTNLEEEEAGSVEWNG